MRTFDAEKFDRKVNEFLGKGVFVTVGGGTIRVLAGEAAKFFGMSFKTFCSHLGLQSEKWHDLFYRAGGFNQDGNNVDAHGFGRFLERNW